MLKANRTYVVLLLIFIFAFAYRLLLMLWAGFPSGADIGLHNSVIHSITQGGNTNFLWDFYQMGGGQSLTFPGYHIFTSEIILMTGLTDYVAQAVVVAFFSSIIVLCAYLITRSVWNESAAFIVAFLVAVSRVDMEMLLWGGYPNVITLVLIPLAFYLFLQKDRFTLTPFLASTSLLVGSIYLTHSLSAAVFVATTVVTVLAVMIVPAKFGASRKNIFFWLPPLALGAVLVSPFLASAVPAYLSANSSFNAISDINSALLSTRLVPLVVVVPLIICPFLFFLLFRAYKGRFLSVPVFLLFMWLLIPSVLTQGYLVGFYVDYNRFLYFVTLPVLILIGMFIDHGSTFFAQSIDQLRIFVNQTQKTAKTIHTKLAKLSSRVTRKTLYAGFVLAILLICFFAFPIFMTPWVGTTDQSYYQVMDNPGYQAIQWIKQNTPTNSNLTSDALYGWWLSGFAERPTYSAVDPQYLTVSRELWPAKNASLLLDTDYMIDNGYVQVREDGGYIARHNPEILVDLNWTYFPYSFFDFDSNQIQIEYQVNGSVQYVYLNQLSIKDMRLDNESTYATIMVTRGNEFFNYTQLTTVYKDSAFVNMTTSLDSAINGVALDYVAFNVQSKGQLIELNNNTASWIDIGVKAFGQIIFGNGADVRQISDKTPYVFSAKYSLDGKTSGQIQILASAYSVTDSLQYYKDDATIYNYFSPIISANLNQPRQVLGNLNTFDYKVALQQYSISYIVNRDFDLNPKFECDPAFSLVFINNEVAIFKVERQHSWELGYPLDG